MITSREVNHFMLSEFTVKQIASQSVKRLRYDNEKVFLGEESNIKVINDRKTGKLSKILVINKTHFKAFDIAEDKNSINYQFSGHFSLDNIKDHTSHKCHEFAYHNIDGGDLLWLASSPNNPKGRYISSKFPYKACRVNLSQAQEGHLEKAAIIDEYFLEAFLSDKIDLIVEPINLENLSINSNFFFATKYYHQGGTRKKNSSTKAYHIKTVTKRKGPLGKHSKKVFELFRRDSHQLQKANKLAEIHRLKFKSDFGITRDSHAKLKFEANTNKSIKFQRILDQKNPDLICCIFQTEIAILVNLFDLRRKKLLTSTTVTVYEIGTEIHKNLGSQSRRFNLLNVSYCHQERRLWMAFRAETNLAQTTNLDLILSVENVFGRKKKNIIVNHMNEKSSFHVNEKECTLLVLREAESKIYFTFEEFSRALEPKLDWAIEMEPIGPLKRFHRLDDNRILIVDQCFMYLMDPKKSAIIDQIQHSHLPFNKKRTNLTLEEDKLIIWSKHGDCLEVFNLRDQDLSLDFIGRFRTGKKIANEKFNIETSRMVRVKTLNDDKLLISYTTEGISFENHMNSTKQGYLNLLVLDLKTRSILSKNTIYLSELRTEVLQFYPNSANNDDDDIIILSFLGDLIQGQMLTRKGQGYEISSTFYYVTEEEEGDYLIKNIHLRKRKVIVQTTTTGLVHSLFVLEIKKDFKTGEYSFERVKKESLCIGEYKAVEEKLRDLDYVLAVGSEDPPLNTENEDTDKEKVLCLKVFDLQLDLMKKISLDTKWIGHYGYELRTSSQSNCVDSLFFIKFGRSNVMVFDFARKEVGRLSEEFEGYKLEFWGEKSRLIGWSGEIVGLQREEWIPNSFLSVDLC